MKSIKIKDKNKLVAYLYFYLNYDPKIKERADFVTDLVKDMRESRVVGFAGFAKKEGLKKDLLEMLFSPGNVKTISKPKFNKKEILKISKKTIKRCHEEILSKPTRIFIFPALDSFTKNKLSGVKGFCRWQYSILINIFPNNKTKEWKKVLKRLICHEYNHSVVAKATQKEPIKWNMLEAIIYEGFSTNFEEYICKKPGPYAKALSKKDCEKYFLKIKKHFNLKGKNQFKLYKALFYEGKKYPLWAGYSIGYQVVKDFLEKNPKLKWQEIIKTNPKKVLKESSFGKL